MVPVGGTISNKYSRGLIVAKVDVRTTIELPIRRAIAIRTAVELERLVGTKGHTSSLKGGLKDFVLRLC